MFYLEKKNLKKKLKYNTFFFNEIIIFLQNKHFSWKKKKNLKTSKK